MRPEIVLFGDSITEQSFSIEYGGWGAALTDAYSRKADVVVRGYSGYNTRWALFPILGSTTPPVAATVFLGANDAALPARTSQPQHVPLQEYKLNLTKIVRHLKLMQECSPTMLILLITPPPIDEEARLQDAVTVYGENAMTLPERTNEAAGNYANACVEVANELAVSSINLWSKMQQTQGWQKKFLSDGLHLTPDGNKVVFEEVVKVFNGAGLSAPGMPSDFPHHSEIDPQNPAKVFQERGLL